MLLAYEKGAALIVSVGAHFNLIEFLDRKRGGMSSTFLTRLRIGEKLVDAKGVSRLYNPGSALGPAGALPRRLRDPAGDSRDRLAGAQRPGRPDLAEDQDLARWLVGWNQPSRLMGYSARYHATSLIAVFLALAIGILIGAALGGDTLDDTRKDLERSLTGNLEDARERAEELSGELGRAASSPTASTRRWSATGCDGQRIGLRRASATCPATCSDEIEEALGPTGGAAGRGRGGARAADLRALAGDLGEDPLRRDAPTTRRADGLRRRGRPPARPRRDAARAGCAAASSRAPAATSAGSTG